MVRARLDGNNEFVPVAESVSLPGGTVTLMFTDIEGSTVLARAVGARMFAELVAQHQEIIRAAVGQHHGNEIDTAGDGFFVVFATARDAVAAAVEIQRSLRGHDWSAGREVRVRIGIHTGEPNRTASGYAGIAVHRAARICASGHGGQVLLSTATAGIIEDEPLPGVSIRELGEYRLPGLAGPQRLVQLEVAGLSTEFPTLRSADGGLGGSAVGTFLLTDLIGWKDIVLALGDRRSGSLMAEYQQRVASAMEASNGSVLERAGDEAIAVFAKATDAIAAVDSLRASLEHFPWPPGMEPSLCGVIHSGRWSGTLKSPEAGTAIYRLRRISDLVGPGQIVISEATAAMLDGDEVHHRLRRLVADPTSDTDRSVVLHELSG